MDVGKTYNRLTVVKYVSSREVICLCKCGREHISDAYSIRKGRTKSCGCLKKEGLHRKHGAKSGGEIVIDEYHTWAGMRARCNNPNHVRYKDYGGRGIKVCPEWDDFSTFLSDMGRRPSKRHSIERLDVDKGYYPDNCIWADDVTQSRNRRISSNNKSGVTGVGWNKRSQKWRARITVNGEPILLGYFENKEEAISARREAEELYWK